MRSFLVQTLGVLWTWICAGLPRQALRPAWLAVLAAAALCGNASATVASPSTAAGSTAFTAVCSGCHPVSYPTQHFNGANRLGYLQWARLQGMFAATDDQLADIAAYLGLSIGNSPANGSVAYNPGGAAATPFALSNLYMNTSYGGITSVASVSGPSKGSVSYSIVGSVATANYTPNPGATGNDTWTYRASGPAGVTSTRTASVFIAGASSTALNASPASTAYGATTTLTATVTGNSPTGTVTFKDNGSTIGSASISGATATLLVSTLSVGLHNNLTAVYAGNSNNATSTSTAATHTVTKASSSTLLGNNPSSTTVGASTTLTATVSGVSPTGTVSFFDGASQIGSAVALSGGTASTSVSNLGVGGHALTAVYSGDANHFTSTSLVATQTVNAALSGSTLSSSVNPTALGAATTLLATVSGVNPTGFVVFLDGASPLGAPVSLVSGQASIAVSSLSLGSHALSVAYSGDSNNISSDSAVLTHVVKTVSSTSLASGTNPSVAGSSITLSASVSGAAPTGTVGFYDGASLIGSATLSGGIATLNVSSLASGMHNLSTVYNADANNLGSSSAVLVQNVKAVSGTVLASSVNPTAYLAATTLTATVSGSAPTGSVSFFDGATALGSSTLSAGVATLTVSSLSMGPHTLTASYAGDLNNAPGTSPALPQVVNPNAVPTITSPASGGATTFALQVSTTLQLVATNLTTSFAVTPALPAGFSLNTATGLITILPTQPMAATSYSFTANNLIGDSAPVTLSFAVASPPPTACAASGPLNTVQTIDLAACLFAGVTPSGFSVSMAPQHGSAVVSGSQLLYTPANNYFGTDALMVVASFGSLKSAVGTVTLTITGRPDPSQDATVTALVANQTQTAVRFAQTQVANFGRHMEGLRRPGGSGLRGTAGLAGTGAQVLSPGASPATWAAPMGANLANPVSNGYSAYSPSTPASQLPGGTAPTASLPIESGVAMALGQLGLPQAPLIGLLYNLEQNRKLDLGALQAAFGGGGGGGAPDGTLPGNTVWVEGVASFGARDASGGLSASEFSSSGISMGLDMPVSENFTWGLGLGLASDTTHIGSDGSRNQARGYSLAAYGSYLWGKNAFVEGMLGLGTVDFDMRRWVDPAADFALSQRKGTQIFGSVGTGLEWRKNGQMVSPYMRLDFSQDRLEAVTESGAGSYALHYFEQTSTSTQAVLGLRGEAVHSAPFGWVVPRARAEWRQDLRDGSEAVISYADLIGGARYAIAPTDSRRSALVLGLGSEFLFRDGWSLGLDYQLSRVSSAESSYAIRLRLSKELGAKGLPKLLREDEEIVDDENEITVDSSVSWDDNITRAKAGPDVRADTVYSVNASRSLETTLGPNTRLIWTGLVGGERFQATNGLSKYILSGEAQLQYRGSAAFDAVTWGLVGKVTGEDFQSELRDGVRYAVGLTAALSLTDRLALFGGLTHNLRHTASAVFNTEDSALRLNLDYSLGRGATLYLGAEYRDGDIVSTGRPSLENLSTAKVLVQDDAYAGGQLRSYRLQASTVLATVGLNLGLGARDSLDISWRRIESTPALRPAWASSASSYIANQVSASYLMRF